MFSEDEMRARFWALKRQGDAIRAEAQPYREQRDALQPEVERLQDAQRELADKFHAIESPLFDIDMEMGSIVRALKGKTGEPQ